MKPVPLKCQCCRGRKRRLSMGEANYYVAIELPDMPRSGWGRPFWRFVAAAVKKDRWACARRCAKRAQRRLARRGIACRISRFKVTRLQLGPGEPTKIGGILFGDLSLHVRRAGT